MTENEALDQVAIDQENIASIIADLYDYLGRFICYPSEEAHVAHALWCAHAHLMDHWITTPRLAFLSAEPESGKSRALDITCNVVPNPVQTVNVSPAYLIRKIGDQENRPTICFDEIDTVFGPKAKDNEDIRGLLNAGYRRGATSGRCTLNGKGGVKTEDIPCYAAVALAGLSWLPETIMGRSIIIRMKRRKPGQKVEPYRPRMHEARGHAIRANLHGWAATVDRIEWPDMPPEIQDRTADIWEPLIAVADMVGGEWPELARNAAVILTAKAKDVELSLGIKLLMDIRKLFLGLDVMATSDLLAELARIEDSPWATINGGHPLNSYGLSKRLKEYDIKSDDIRFGGRVLKGYRKGDFADAWEMYLPRVESPSVAPVADVADFG